MAEMKHSMEEALKIQQAFERQFGSKDGLLGVGIGLNPERNDLALSVSVSERTQVEDLPKSFNGLDIVVDVVGVIRA